MYLILHILWKAKLAKLKFELSILDKVGKVEICFFSHNGQNSGSRQSWQSWGHLWINMASLLSKQSWAKLRHDFSHNGQNSDSRQSWQSWGQLWINMASLLSRQSWQS